MAGAHPYSVANSPETNNSGDNRRDELELGLTLGGACRKPPAAPYSQYCRILTAEDFPSLCCRASPKTSPNSSVSSSSPASTKRPAGEVEGSPVNSQCTLAVGWPPVGSFRINNLLSHPKDGNVSETGNNQQKAIKKTNDPNEQDNSGIKTSMDQKSRGQSTRTSFLVKVNMDGDPIGRKVDLSAHHSYEDLAQILELMFHKPNGLKVSELLDGSSEFALTYEDREGDWMLVGDVPWEMFLDTVKRLRIMRTSDTNGLAPRFQAFNKANGLKQAFFE